MKYAVEMGTEAMIDIPSFIEVNSDIQKLIRGIHKHTGSMMIICIYFWFFKTRKVG
jgi:hypothetical protein